MGWTDPRVATSAQAAADVTPPATARDSGPPRSQRSAPARSRPSARDPTRLMIVARIERLEAADIRDADTRSRRLARHAEAVRVPFQASGLLLRTRSSSQLNLGVARSPGSAW